MKPFLLVALFFTPVCSHLLTFSLHTRRSPLGCTVHEICKVGAGHPLLPTHPFVWENQTLRAPANSNIMLSSQRPFLNKGTKLWQGKVKTLWKSKDVQVGDLRGWKCSCRISATSPRTQQFRALSADNFSPWCPLVKNWVKWGHPEALVMGEEKGREVLHLSLQGNFPCYRSGPCNWDSAEPLVTTTVPRLQSKHNSTAHPLSSMPHLPSATFSRGRSFREDTQR